MRLLALVRRELLLLGRSPGLWVAFAAFAGVLALGAVLPELAFDDPDPRLGAAFLLGPATDIVLPVIAIVFGHSAIAARRETGEAKYLLAMPYRRAELVLGILGTRVAAVAGIAAVGCLPAALAVRLVYGELPVGRTAGFVVATAGAAAVYTAVAVAVSASVRTRLRALGICLGGYVAAYALWEPTLEALRVAGDVPAGRVDQLEGLSPLDAYGTAADVLLPAAPQVQLALADGNLAADQGEIVGAAGPSVGELAGPVFVLLAWALLPTLVALVRFQRADLG